MTARRRLEVGTVRGRLDGGGTVTGGTKCRDRKPVPAPGTAEVGRAPRRVRRMVTAAERGRPHQAFRTSTRRQR